MGYILSTLYSPLSTLLKGRNKIWQKIKTNPTNSLLPLIWKSWKIKAINRAVRGKAFLKDFQLGATQRSLQKLRFGGAEVSG